MVSRVASSGGRRAVFTGVARNCAPYLRDVLRSLERLERAYETIRYVFAVGDSNDGTFETLRNWVTDDRSGHVIDMACFERSEPRRTVRIAMARNACMALLRSAYPDYDHVVVLNMDNILVDPVSDAAFAEACAWLDSDECRAAVFANAAPQYYDVWALRHPRWCPYDVWHAIWDRHRWCPFEFAKFKHVYAKQVRIAPSATPIPVRSAFGGLAIYKMRFIKSAQYSGEDAHGRERAEHVSFNEAIADRGGGLFVIPSLVVRAPPEHLFDAAGASAWLKLAVWIKNLPVARRLPC